MMDCKHALSESKAMLSKPLGFGCDKKGIATAAKKATRVTSEEIGGQLHSRLRQDRSCWWKSTVRAICRPYR